MAMVAHKKLNLESSILTFIQGIWNPNDLTRRPVIGRFILILDEHLMLSNIPIGPAT